MLHAADITDYLAGIRHARAPSGVTRVQTRLLAADRGHFTLVAHHGPSDSWRAFPRAMFDRLLAGTHGTGGVRDPGWQALVDEAEAVLAASPEHRWAPGDWLLGIGTAWWLPGHSGRILAAKEEHGIRYASFVYDLIPLLVPEHCEPKLVRNFTQHFAALCLLADHAICISEAVRRDFLAWLPKFLPGTAIPASVLPLDARFDPPAEPGIAPAEPFVLAVGTVESRKNQLGLLRAWLKLIRDHGEENAPLLVVVGVHGYLSDQVVGLRDAAPELARRVEFRPGVTDQELAALYAGCLFTVFNSLAEGWGLPATESLAWGKLPVLADVPVLRESGGPHAVYVEPENVPALTRAIHALLADPLALHARQEALRAGTRLREWPELAAQCASFLGAPSGGLPLDRAFLHLAEPLPGGLPAPPALPALPPVQHCMGPLLRLGSGWSWQEDWGAWATAPGRVALRLPMDPALAGHEVSVLLEANPPPGGHQGRARAGDGPWQGWHLPAEGPGLLRVDAVIPASGPLRVELDLGAGVPCPPDHRLLGLGLRQLSVVARRDAPEAAPPPPPAPPPRRPWWKRLLG